MLFPPRARDIILLIDKGMAAPPDGTIDYQHASRPPMDSRKTILFGAALAAGAAIATVAAVQFAAPPAPVAEPGGATAAAVDPLAHSPCSAAPVPARPASDAGADPLAHSPCSAAPPATR